MKRRMLCRIALMLMLAVSSTSAFFALADAVETVVADPGGIELELDEAVEFPDEGELILDDGALILDDDLDDGLALDGLLDLQLDENALLAVADEAALWLEAASVEVNGGVQANTQGVTDSATVSGGMDNDALFEVWMKQVLPGMTPNRTQRSALSGRAMLDDINLKLYDALVPMIRQTAEGKRTSTLFPVSDDAVGLTNSWWTAGQLGLESLDDGKLGAALLSKEGFVQKKILQALLADYPYELYWFDKVTGGMAWSFGVMKQDGKARLTSLTAKLAVAVDYAKTGAIGTYEVNELPARVTAAASNIEGIVSNNAGKDDLTKLKAYANVICSLVAYNNDAAGDSNTPYGDPWQLVYIFDGDESTKVVCEGYSKGFKYLCDLSDFDGDVACELMSGSIPSGNHMWNALRMPDGRVYLADITNSDGGDACNEKYFLKGCKGQTSTAFTCGTLTYTYRAETLENFSSEWLTMSVFNYGEAVYTVQSFSGTYDGSAHGASVFLDGDGTVSYGTEKGVYDRSSSPTWKNAGSYTVYFCADIKDYGIVEGQTWVTIAPKTVDLNWANTAFTYDGNAYAPTATATGLLSGDKCAVTVSGAQKNAGSYTARATGLSNGNYKLPSTVTRTFAISQRVAQLAWTNTDMTYNGKAQGPRAAVSNLVSGDSCAVTVLGGQTDAGSYTATATGLSNGNYALPESATQAFTIAQKTVGLKWSSTRLTYNGKAQKPTVAATGLVSGDSCAVTVLGGQTDAGSYTATATGLSNGNYALPESATQAFTIAPKTVGLKWSRTRLTYNGKIQSPTVKATGLVSGDSCTVTVLGGKKNAGSYTAKASALSNGNYALPKTTTQAFTIAPKTVKLKWSRTSLAYNGKTQKPTVKATGLVSGDKCTVTVTGGRRNAGNYRAKAAGLSNANYALPKARTRICTIRKKTVRLKWTGTRLKYNGEKQKPTATAIGLIKGDRCRVTVSGAKKKKGTYTATATALSNRNYQLPSKATVRFRIY